MAVKAVAVMVPVPEVAKEPPVPTTKAAVLVEAVTPEKGVLVAAMVPVPEMAKLPPVPITRALALVPAATPENGTLLAVPDVAIQATLDIQTLPEATSGKVKVWSAVGLVTAMKVSLVSATEPSKIKPFWPKISLLAARLTSPDKAVLSSRARLKEAALLPAEPPVRPVRVEVLALAT